MVRLAHQRHHRRSGTIHDGLCRFCRRRFRLQQLHHALCLGRQRQFGARLGRLCRDDLPYLEFTTPRVPWSQRSTARHREYLQSLPVSTPVPLRRETAGGRVRLGGVFLAASDLMRARIEFKRALELEPRSAEARRGLKRIESYYRDAAPVPDEGQPVLFKDGRSRDR